MELPFKDLLVLIAVKRMYEKKIQKVIKKRDATNEVKNGNGGVGSLKTEENKTSEDKTSRHGLKHALRA